MGLTSAAGDAPWTLPAKEGGFAVEGLWSVGLTGSRLTAGPNFDFPFCAGAIL